MMGLMALIRAVASALVVVGLLTSCDVLRSTPSPHPSKGIPTAPPIVESVTWGTGWCSFVRTRACSASITFDGPDVAATFNFGGPSHRKRRVLASLNEKGVTALGTIATALRDAGIETYPGGAGVAIDGVTFLVVVSTGAQKTTYSWNVQRRPSAMHAAYDRMLRLITHLADCRADPWALVGAGCIPVPRRNR